MYKITIYIKLLNNQLKRLVRNNLKGKFYNIQTYPNFLEWIF